MVKNLEEKMKRNANNGTKQNNEQQNDKENQDGKRWNGEKKRSQSEDRPRQPRKENQDGENNRQRRPYKGTCWHCGVEGHPFYRCKTLPKGAKYDRPGHRVDEAAEGVFTGAPDAQPPKGAQNNGADAN